MRKARGFTLIELMVAIAAMALLALMSWRGLDAMGRAETQNRTRADAVLTLQTALAQWGADLDATVTLSQIQAMDWNGSALRLTRRSTDSSSPVMYVVAWALRADPNTGTTWRRWQSPGFTTRSGWQQAWDGAASWAGDSSAGMAGDSGTAGAEVTLMPLADWQLSYFLNGSWGQAVSAQSLAAAAGGGAPMPDGVRVVLNLPEGNALAGLLVRDWVRPTLTVPKS